MRSQPRHPLPSGPHFLRPATQDAFARSGGVARLGEWEQGPYKFSVLALAAMLAKRLPLRSAQPAPPKPYKAVTVTPPVPVADPAFDALRKQVGEAAQKKDRAAMAPLVVAQGFFWQRDGRDRADKRKSGVDNLSNALGLNSKDGAGWDILFSYTDDPTASPSSGLQGRALCTGRAIPQRRSLRRTPQVDAVGACPSGVTRCRLQPTWRREGAGERAGRRETRSHVRAGRARQCAGLRRLPAHHHAVGQGRRFVTIDSVAPLGNDQLCYVKDAGAWKIGGYIGGGESQ